MLFSELIKYKFIATRLFKILGTYEDLPNNLICTPKCQSLKIGAGAITGELYEQLVWFQCAGSYYSYYTNCSGNYSTG